MDSAERSPQERIEKLEGLLIMHKQHTAKLRGVYNSHQHNFRTMFDAIRTAQNHANLTESMLRVVKERLTFFIEDFANALNKIDEEEQGV